MANFKLTEGIERGSLARLLHNELHIDQFKSKMGEDSDVIVLSFKITSKQPALDLVDFIEKGYDWVLDADTSSGELDDGDFIVFVEIERTDDAPANIIKMINDVNNLCDFKMSDWRWRYHRGIAEYELTEDKLREIVPLTYQQYEKKFGKKELDQLKNAAGVKVDTKAPVNEFTESLRIAAGIK